MKEKLKTYEELLTHHERRIAAVELFGFDKDDPAVHPNNNDLQLALVIVKAREKNNSCGQPDISPP